MKTTARTIVIIVALFIVTPLFDGVFDFGMRINEAEAIVGRPLTPLSVAGTARRTTRRVIRRTSVYVAALPAGCTTVVIEGTTLHRCGGTYYQPYNNKFVVVNVE